MKSLGCSLLFSGIALLSSCSIHLPGWSGEPSVWVEHTKVYEFPSGDLSAASLRGHNGNIAVRGVDDDGLIVVEVTRRAGGDDEEDAREALAHLEIVTEIQDDELHVATGWEDRRRHWQGRVSYEVTQPAHLAVEARVHNGRVVIDGVDAPVTVKTHNGSAKVVGAIPELRLKTHNGQLQTLLAPVQDFKGRITSHNGSIRVGLEPGASTQVRAETHNGGISAGDAVEETARGKRHFVGRIGSGEGELFVKTHNGNIRIR